MRIVGVTDTGREFLVTAKTFKHGVTALKEFGKNPSLGYGTGGSKVQPSSLLFIKFSDAGPIETHTPEIDVGPLAAKKRF